MTDQSRIQTVEYSNWAKGSVFAKGLAPGQGEITDYQAMNMQVYVDGQLGPRPFTRRHLTTPGGQSGVINASADTTNGWLLAFPLTNTLMLTTSVGTYYMTVNGTTWTSLTTPTGSSATLGGPWTGTGGVSGFVAFANMHYGSVIKRELVTVSRSRWDPSNPATLAVALGSPVTSATYGAVPWKDRVFCFGDGNRIFYSDIVTGTTITFASASQFIDIGYAPIEGVYPLRDALLIYSSAGIWYALTGNTPSAWSVREIGRGRFPDRANRAVIYGNSVWFINSVGRGVAIVTPEGIETSALSHISPNIFFRPLSQYLLGSTTVPYPALASEPLSAVILPFLQNDGSFTEGQPPSGFQAIEFVNDSVQWTRFWGSDFVSAGFSPDIPGNAATVVYGPVEMKGVIWFVVNERYHANNTTDCVALYTRNITLNRPSKNSDFYSAQVEELGGIYAQNGNGTNMAAGEIWLRQFAPEPGFEVRVRKIIADVTYWQDTGYAGLAGSLRLVNEAGTLLDLNLSGTGAENNMSDVATGDTGTPGRIIWRPTPLEFSDFVQVQLRGLVSIALRRVIVEYEIRPSTPRA